MGTKAQQTSMNLATTSDKAAVCLGMEFPNDDARRGYFRDRLRERLEDPDFRSQDGFPNGSIEDIIEMSDPPYYTACPNPFLKDYVAMYGKPWSADEPYSRAPLAIDVTVGKGDALYKAHGYHTKIPHQAIVPSILHYTKPGDLIVDGFCGSGMTGVAAAFCGVAPPNYRAAIEGECRETGQPVPEWGARRAVLSDLSPYATSIAAGYNLDFSLEAFIDEAERILAEAEERFGELYSVGEGQDSHRQFDFTVWSEVFNCSQCGTDNIFFEAAFNPDTGKVDSEFPCLGCGAIQSKEQMDLAFEQVLSRTGRGVVQRPRRVPVLIKYKVNRTSKLRSLDDYDKEVIRRANDMADEFPIPDAMFPDSQMVRVGRMATTKVKAIEDLLFKRSSLVISFMWHEAGLVSDRSISIALKYWIDSHFNNLSLLNRYRPEVSFPYNPLNGVYYVPSVISEANPFVAYRNRLKRLKTAFSEKTNVSCDVIISCGTASSIDVLSNSVDYIFTDPPFGENIYYADLNLFAEAWHGVYTQTASEAIIDRVRAKDLLYYQRAMEEVFGEYYRILKPGRWMTVVFSNSKSSVWNAIQVALQQAGFVVAEVTALDKTQGSFKQVTSTNAVKQDLVVSCYKPNGGLEERFERGVTDETPWDFVRTHLKNLAVVKISKEGHLEAIGERDPRRIFDRMVAWFVRHNTPVPISSAEFQEGLRHRFSERDGMIFLENQVSEYDRRRLSIGQPPQRDLFVEDERSAIDWLTDFLKAKPSTYQQVHPEFTQQTGAGWRKHEERPELAGLLEDNFLKYDGKGPIPGQIRGYLRQNWKDFRTLADDDPLLVDKSRDRWYVPDPNKQQDVEKRREKALLKEFERYRDHKGRKLKEVRLEAMRAGFKAAWSAKDYQTIVDVVGKVPEDAWQEDEKLLMYFDMALTRLQADK